MFAQLAYGAASKLPKDTTTADVVDPIANRGPEVRVHESPNNSTYFASRSPGSRPGSAADDLTEGVRSSEPSASVHLQSCNDTEMVEAKEVSPTSLRALPLVQKKRKNSVPQKSPPKIQKSTENQSELSEPDKEVSEAVRDSESKECPKKSGASGPRRSLARILQLLKGEVLPHQCGPECMFCLDERKKLDDNSVSRRTTATHLAGSEQVRDGVSEDVEMDDARCADSDADKPKAVFETNTENQVRIVTAPGLLKKHAVPPRYLAKPCPPVAHKAAQYRHWRVMYGKPNSRKNKVWENDGVLIVDGTAMILVGEDKEEISRTIGVSLMDIQKLSPGFRRLVGSKEVEILEGLKEEEFVSGSYLE